MKEKNAIINWTQRHRLPLMRNWNQHKKKKKENWTDRKRNKMKQYKWNMTEMKRIFTTTLNSNNT